MSPIYTDSEGNEVEFEYTPEEIKELKEKYETVEKEKEELSKTKEILEKEREEKEEKINEMKEELSGLQDKDFNFSKFRKAEKEKQEEMLKDFSEKEKTLVRQIDSMQADNDAKIKKQMDSAEKKILDSLVGDNNDLRDKLKDTAKMFKDQPTTEDEMIANYENAFAILQKREPGIKPLNNFVAGEGDATGGDKEYGKSEKGKAVIAKHFPWAKETK